MLGHLLCRTKLPHVEALCKASQADKRRSQGRRAQPLARRPSDGTSECHAKAVSKTDNPLAAPVSPRRSHWLQHATAEELQLSCVAQHSPSSHCPGRGRCSRHGHCWDPSRPTALEPGNRGENAKSLQFFEVAPGRRGPGGKQFTAKSLHLICVTFRQPHQLWMPGKGARCALRPARAPRTRTPHAKLGPTSPWQPVLIHAGIFKISFLKPHMNRILSR